MGQDCARRGFGGQFSKRRRFGIRRAQPLERPQCAGGVLEAPSRGGELLAIAFILRGLRFAKTVLVKDGLVGLDCDSLR